MIRTVLLLNLLLLGGVRSQGAWEILSGGGFYTTADGELRPGLFETAPADSTPMGRRIRIGEGTYIEDLHFEDSARGAAMLRSGGILHTEDGGRTWIRALGDRAWLEDMDFHGPKFGVAVGRQDGPFTFLDPAGDQGVLFTTRDGGITWIKTLMPVGNIPGTVSVQPGGIAYAAGFQGRFDSLCVWKSVDSGRTWTGIPARQTGSRLAVHFQDGRTGWMVRRNRPEEERSVYKTRDGGMSWTPDTSFNLTPDLPEVPWKMNRGGGPYFKPVVLPSRGRWEERNYDPRKEKERRVTRLDQVVWRTPDSAWGLSREGGVFRTVDGGVHWMLDKSYSTRFKAIATAPGGHAWIYGGKGNLLRWNPDSAPAGLKPLEYPVPATPPARRTGSGRRGG